MPVIRIDEKGNDIQKVTRRKNAKRALSVSIGIYAVALCTFFLYDNMLGLVLSTLPATILSGLNLVDD